MAAAMVYPVFEFGISGLGAFCGVFTTEEKAYEGACIAANAVVLFQGDSIFTGDMIRPFFEATQHNLVLRGENNNEVIILYAPVDATFITQDFTNTWANLRWWFVFASLAFFDPLRLPPGNLLGRPIFAIFGQ